MNVAHIGDPHLGSFARYGGERTCGINVRGHLTLKCLKDGLEAAKAAGAEHAVILGDLIDCMAPAPQLLAEARRVLEASGITIYIIKGNHESNSDQPRDNAIHVLESKNVKIYDEPTVTVINGSEYVLIPFRSGKISRWLPETLEALELKPQQDELRVMCIHAGVKDKDTAPWLQDSAGAIRLDTLNELMEKHGIHRVFAGDWHEHKLMGDIHQVGALCPVGFQDIGVLEYGQVAILNELWNTEYVYVPGPRFLKFGPDGDPESLNRDGNVYFVEWTVRYEDFEAAQAKLRGLIASGLIADGSVITSDSVSKDSFFEGAEEARGVAQIPEATAAFVDTLVLDGVDKSSVLQRTLRYLGV